MRRLAVANGPNIFSNASCVAMRHVRRDTAAARSTKNRRVLLRGSTKSTVWFRLPLEVDGDGGGAAGTIGGLRYLSRHRRMIDRGACRALIPPPDSDRASSL